MHLPDAKPHTSAETFQLLVDAVTDYALYMLDPDGRIVTWNSGAARFKGYAAHEIIGQHFSRFFTLEDQADHLPAMALATAAREGRFEAEGWRVRKDGTRFWAHAILDAIRSEQGALLGFAKITRDITEKRKLEQATYESALQLKMLVQGVSDYAIYMLDKEGKITSWNSGAQAIKGYTEAEVLGQHFSLFYTAPTGPEARRVSHCGPHWSRASSRRRRSGYARTARCSGRMF